MRRRLCKECQTPLNSYNKKDRCYICARKQAMRECNEAPKKNYYKKRSLKEKIKSGYLNPNKGGANVHVGRN